MTPDQRANAVRQIADRSLQQVGDQLTDPKTVLTWLLGGLGAPSFVVALLVPVREAGSMLPQAGLAPLVQRHAQHRWLWVGGAAGQAVAVACMAAFAAFSSGTVAGLGVVGCLGAFSLARSLSSLTSKDILGRTIPKGARGRVSGAAVVASGMAAITVGVGVRAWGGRARARSRWPPCSSPRRSRGSRRACAWPRSSSPSGTSPRPSPTVRFGTRHACW